jgi:CheY-like chemotaxis protein
MAGTELPESELAELWDRSRSTVLGRLEVVDRCIGAWQSGQVDDREWQVARREVQRLAGSLGIFGHSRASQLADELGRLMRAEPRSDPATAAAGLVAALRRELEQTPTTRAAETPISDKAGDPPRPGRPRVLLADDDDVIARAVQTALRLDDIEVLHARDGQEAIHLAQAVDVGLVLLDVQMPVLDGFAVCRTLRADPRMATVPIVMLTAQSDREGVQASFAEGATDYIVKPFAVSQLRARVRTWLLRSADDPG